MYVYYIVFRSSQWRGKRAAPDTHVTFHTKVHVWPPLRYVQNSPSLSSPNRYGIGFSLSALLLFLSHRFILSSYLSVHGVYLWRVRTRRAPLRIFRTNATMMDYITSILYLEDIRTDEKITLAQNDDNMRHDLFFTYAYHNSCLMWRVGVYVSLWHY